MKNRILFIDIARTFAIFMALFAHYLNASGILNDLGNNSLYVKQFTMMATPIFVFMFGFMIELVYTKKVFNEGFPSIKRRVLARAFQCYLAYALTVIASFFGNYLTFNSTINALLFLENPKFGQILRAYAILMLAVPLIIKLRIKFGERFIYLSLIGFLATSLLTANLKDIHLGSIDNLANIFIGAGHKKGGPSIFHCLNFMLAGMFLASSYNRENSEKNADFYKKSLMLIVLALLFLTFLSDFTPGDLWEKFSNSEFRINNRMEYYAIGIITSIILLTLIKIITPNKPGKNIKNPILTLGTYSLASYTIGNILLILAPTDILKHNLWLTIPIFILLVILIIRMSTLSPYYKDLRAVLNLDFLIIDREK